MTIDPTTRELARVARRIARVCAQYEALCAQRDELIRAALAAGDSLRGVGAVCGLTHEAVRTIRDSETTREGVRQ